jgi:hypothetical protein
MRAELDNDTAVRRRAIDALMDCYVAWREACYAVDLAYQRWAEAPPDQNGSFYSGYVAALDREEQASLMYAEHISRFTPERPRERRPSGTVVGLPRVRWHRSA